ncbi:glycosyltransferase family 2 protein [Rhodobium gokarnense]|uniref:Cellulose synthase/poly-beta-1,6-N-acetylglucosamine synthase-like glycosyltransferase n=1 Tax=Rhodobium gokarnense TaxID=364296 RepID=A0ABT3HBE1_9HYPH|nr:glycosyltransferase [Rhodobium gokarnense]MCW2307719.1 cellulose synthase/poly-beta-1,6-N-acetylglucosamine synthase-like glycosyltransferase [Rhodobium gokarnense]
MATLTESDIWTGDHLVEQGLISLSQFDQARRLAEQWNASLIDVLLARNWIDPAEYYRSLSERFDIEFVSIREALPDPDLLKEDDVSEYMRELAMPWRKRDGRIVVATARPGPECILFSRRRWGRDVSFVVTSKFDIHWAVQNVFSDQYSQRAVFELAERDPVMSAQTVFTPTQIIVGWFLMSAAALGLAFAPVVSLIAINLVLSLFYFGNFLFKAILIWAGGNHQTSRTREVDAGVRMLRDEDLPIYTVLVPMFREPEVLPIITNALRHLDYPTSRLDIKIVLEEGDTETIDAAMALGLEGIFEIIRVPPSEPQTKPKACNYALRFARGDYVVIYDAEDKPEPDQLKKVVAAFRQAPDHIACVQCRLNYFNRDENWLTRLFTLDYSLWFDLMLPGLERLGVPIPLGGTSNHFRIEVLRELHAWDPFNVTEDADLGIRMTQKGYGVWLIESTTFEEANVSHANWIRQRSRWIKGYMQTFLVHTRRPIHLMRTIGPLGVLGFVFFIGGTMLSGVLNPIFWGMFVVWVITQTSGFDQLFPPVLLYLALFNLLAGNALITFLMMLAPFRRRWFELIPFSLTALWYWVLMSVAAWKAAVQLITKPFYWEKTHHGLSNHTAAAIAIAARQTEEKAA